MPMCKPATASKCAKPESRNAARSSAGMAVPRPVSTVAATAPSVPGKPASSRPATASRTLRSQSARLAGGAWDSRLTGPSAIPAPPKPLK